jgi:Chlorite dismutase
MTAYPPKPQRISFRGGNEGRWRVTRQEAVTGAPVESVAAVAIDGLAKGTWTLTGVTSNLRYTTADERTGLDAASDPLGRRLARRAVLIPIRKSPAWWALAQDERRAIYARSAHTPIGMAYLPAIARRLHHSRDLGEPFDFLTWFEFAPEHASDFDTLLARLRATEEWRYVDREIEIRLARAD